MSDPSSLLLAGSTAGLIGGISLLIRGFGGYRRANRISDTPTSSIEALAVGEVRVSGTVEPAELALTSALQSRTCVYYHARIREREGRTERTVLDDERAVGFRVRDATGSIRVFPRGAAWDVPAGFAESDGFAGDTPPGLALRDGPSTVVGSPDRDAQVTSLLTVRTPVAGEGLGPSAGGLDPLGLLSGRGRRRYEEAVIEPGDIVTIVGTALPFDQLPDPEGDDVSDTTGVGGPLSATSDPEIAADLAAAQAAGSLATDPSEAWGNAAIPGFGIGQPVREPDLDPAARHPVLAGAATADRYARTFAIAPGELVLSVTSGRPMLIAAGAPVPAAERDQDTFLVGLLGAVLAIASAVGFALAVGMVRP